MEKILRDLIDTPSLDLASADPHALDAPIKAYASTVNDIVKEAGPVILDEADKLLTTIDPALQSIAYLAVLSVALTNPEPSPTTLDGLVRFLLRFNPIQIRYVGKQFRSLLEQVSSDRLLPVQVTAHLLTTALTRLDPLRCTFTSTHLLVAEYALRHECSEPFLPLIRNFPTFYANVRESQGPVVLCNESLDPINYLNTRTGLSKALTSTDVLEYFARCALIFLTRRDWERAQMYLEQIVAYPTKDKNTSKIMVEAHKKWLLVGLISQGKAPTLSIEVALATRNAYNALNLSYINIATHFSNGKIANLREEVRTGEAEWVTDKNTSLVKAVLQAYQKWQIVGLSQVYLQVSLSAIRKSTASALTGKPLESDAEIATLLQEMITTGMLKGRLEQDSDSTETYLVFEDEDESLSERAFVEAITKSRAHLEEVGKQYQLLNERLSSSKEYGKHLVREADRAAAGRETEDGFPLDGDVEEEDLMVDAGGYA